jgi:phospholipase A1
MKTEMLSNFMIGKYIIFFVIFLSKTATAEYYEMEEDDLFTQRSVSEKQSESNQYALTAYKQNYILPVTYNSEPNQQHELLDPVEIKFQISLKVTLLENLFNTNSELAVAYTQQNFWQAYNNKISSPFRETNYEPEVFWGLHTNNNILGMQLRYFMFGFVHQSNGRSQLLSRSWNRLYLNFIFRKGNFYLSLKPWYRIPEDPKTNPSDASGDDNPDILDYMGHGEVKAFYRHNKHEVSIMLRNNLTSDNKGAVQIDWAYPAGNKLKWYVQYFNGYGESLIDYNHRVNKIGVGILLTNWL